VNEYELTVLVGPNSETDAKNILDKVAGVVSSIKGKITRENDWGKKRLEYKIKGETHAIFHFYEIELAGDAVAKLDRTLNITEGVLRHLIVKVDAKKKALIEEVNSKKKTKEE
jgi:small subunit ribosomal protein S6